MEQDTFSQRLRRLLSIRGLTQTELSAKTGISKSSISHYLKGDWEPKKDAIHRIAVVTEVNENWLAGYAPNIGGGLIVSNRSEPFCDLYSLPEYDIDGNRIEWSQQEKELADLHNRLELISPSKYGLIRKILMLPPERLDALATLLNAEL